MFVIRLLVVSFVLVALGATTAQASLIVNGSFETGIPFEIVYYYTLWAPDSTSIPGWVVSSGSIDYINTIWNSADGGRSLDMNGTGTRGSIYQEFATLPGHLYEVSFAMSGNPGGGARETGWRYRRAAAARSSPTWCRRWTLSTLGGAGSSISPGRRDRGIFWPPAPPRR